jgi:NADH-quinone oxidoreductase subunit N
MTLAMLGLAGIPATAGFMGKFYLIDAAVSGGYTWLGVVIVIGSMISLGYYLPVVAAMWMREAPQGDERSAGAEPFPVSPPPGGALPAIAGGSPELDDDERSHVDPLSSGGERASAPQVEVVFVALLAGAATLFFGIVPQPLFDFVQHAGRGLGLF